MAQRVIDDIPSHSREYTRIVCHAEEHGSVPALADYANDKALKGKGFPGISHAFPRIFSHNSPGKLNPVSQSHQFI